MSEVKIEQLQNFFKSFGLEDEDFAKLSAEPIEDFTPFVEKMRGHVKNELMADTSFVEEISKPFKDAPIGKENQLKKEARKFFSLQMTEDELKKTPLSEILKRGTESLKSTVNVDVEKFQNAAAEWMEKYEALEASIPDRERAVEEKWQSKYRDQQTKEELISLSATEAPGIAKENLSHFVTTLLGFANQNGHKITIDERKQVKILDSEGMPLKNEQGHIVRTKDYIKDFASKLNVNIAPKGAGTPIPGGIPSKQNDLLALMGKGLMRN